MKKILLAALAAVSLATPALATGNRPQFGLSIELGNQKSHDYRGYENRYRSYEDRRFVYYNGQKYRLVARRNYCSIDTTAIRIDYRGFICVDDYDYRRSGYLYR